MARAVSASARDYFWKIANGVQSSALIPAVGRTALLRLLGVKISGTSRIAEGVYLGSRKLEMALGSFVNVGSFIDGSALVKIGEHVRIGPYVKVLTGTHPYEHSVIRRRRGGPTLNLPVTVERGCWIGIGCIILPGVTVAEGCVVAAGSVVISDTEPNGLYAGVPAVRRRDLDTRDDAGSVPGLS